MKDHTFVSVERIKGGEFMAQGILGLAPSSGSESFVNSLKSQKVIEK